MPEYRRAFEPGGLFFFTVVTYRRNRIFSNSINRKVLFAVWHAVQIKHPFITIAFCLLPDHIHVIWKLPEGDSDYSMRWKEIKRLFTKEYLCKVDEKSLRNASRLKQGEAAVWQRRFWEHTIEDEDDLNYHIDYIHFNPIKHELVSELSDWKWSSFHKYLDMGKYPPEWGQKNEIANIKLSFGE